MIPRYRYRIKFIFIHLCDDTFKIFIVYGSYYYSYLAASNLSPSLNFLTWTSIQDIIKTQNQFICLPPTQQHYQCQNRMRIADYPGLRLGVYWNSRCLWLCRGEMIAMFFFPLNDIYNVFVLLNIIEIILPIYVGVL